LSDSGPMPRRARARRGARGSGLRIGGGFDAHDVGRFLDHADHFWIAAGIAAVEAQVAFANVVAEAAETQLVLNVEEGLREMFGVFAAGAQHVEGDALRGFLADAGQVFQCVDEAGQRFGEVGHR